MTSLIRTDAANQALVDRINELEFRLATDGLTGARSRDFFLDSFQGYAENGGALFFIDIDNFKSVNDHYGHRTGDLLLKRIVEKVQICLSGGDFIARLGGDEFVVLSGSNDLSHIDNMGPLILDAISAATVTIGELSISRGASIGCVNLFETLDAHAAIDLGDTAMRSAKNLGKNRIHTLTWRVGQKNELTPSVDELMLGLERNEIGYYLQPIVCCRRRCVTGYEALLRWERSDGRVLSPSEFLTTMTDAYSANARPPLEFAREATEWVTLNHEAFCCFNISLSFLERIANRDFDWVMEIIGKSPRDRIVFEITEAAFQSELGRVVEVMEELRKSGIRIALDDFGVGASNLERLQRMPVDIVKMDKRLVRGVAHDAKTRDILKGTIELCHAAGARVVVEGIEQEDQFEIVRELGAEYAQGFHLGLPEPYQRSNQ